MIWASSPQCAPVPRHDHSDPLGVEPTWAIINHQSKGCRTRDLFIHLSSSPTAKTFWQNGSQSWTHHPKKKHTNLQNCQDVICWKTKVSKVRQVTKWPYNHCHSPGLRPEAWLDVHVSNESSVFFLCMLYANSMMVLEIENVLLELVYLESRLNLLPREHHPYQSTKHTK